MRADHEMANWAIWLIRKLPLCDYEPRTMGAGKRAGSQSGLEDKPGRVWPPKGVRMLLRPHQGLERKPSLIKLNPWWEIIP